MFLNETEIIILTGRKMKSHQVRALQKMGLPFFVNATGRAVVARSIIDGKEHVQVKRGWSPRVLENK